MSAWVVSCCWPPAVCGVFQQWKQNKLLKILNRTTSTNCCGGKFISWRADYYSWLSETQPLSWLRILALESNLFVLSARWNKKNQQLTKKSVKLIAENKMLKDLEFSRLLVFLNAYPYWLLRKMCCKRFDGLLELWRNFLALPFFISEGWN